MLSLGAYNITAQVSEDNGISTYIGSKAADESRIAVRFSPIGTPPESKRIMLRDFAMSQSVGNLALTPVEQVEIAEGVATIFDVANVLPLRTVNVDRVIDVGRFLRMSIAIVGTVAELHARDVIHKNLNLDSVWYDPVKDIARLSQFGIASFTSHDGELILSKMEGSPAFISPEQTGRVNRSVDRRTDCYALGVIFYSMLTGRLPFQLSDSLELIHAHLAKKPTPPIELVPDIPQVLSDITMKMMSKTADKRYQRLAVLCSDLEQCLDQWESSNRINSFPLGKNDTHTVLDISQRLYGREAELKSLSDALQEVLAGRTKLIQVSGDPGSGKTALVQELRGDVAILGGHFIDGKFDQYKRSKPYSAIIDAFRGLVLKLLGEPDDVLSDWRHRFIDELGAHAQVVIDVIPELELIIGSQSSVPELPPPESRNRFIRAFRNFVHVVAGSRGPLVLFLDDMQWTDMASLSFMEDFLTDVRSSPILLICAYRANEMHGAHPFVQILDSVSKSLKPLVIEVPPITVDNVTELVVDTFGCTAKVAAPLAGLIYAKTAGNPFFLHQFLRFLEAELLVRYSDAHDRWDWDLEEINERGISQDILQLMSAKVSTLSDFTQNALKIAAAISNSFNLKTLALVSGLDLSNLRKAAREALRKGILLTRAEGYPLADENILSTDVVDSAELRFLHDHVQQAAYSLVEPEDRASLNLTIGRILLQQWQITEEELPFDVVNHLNTGRELISDPEEIRQLASFNVRSARRAQESIAFNDALEYLDVAASLLGENVWEDDPDLAFQMNMAKLECEYQAGNSQFGNQIFERMLSFLNDPHDRAKVFYTKILVETAKDRNDEAILLGIEALSEFRVRVPSNPGSVRLTALMLKVRGKLLGKTPSELADLPPVSDESIKAVMQLLMSICPAAYFSNPKVMFYAVLKIVDLTQSYGNASASAYGYILYALVLGAEFGDYRKGHEFGRLALEMSGQSDDPLLHCKVNFIFHGLIDFWRTPASQTVAGMRSAYQSALAVGDIQYATYALQFFVQFCMFRGIPLDELQDECAKIELFTSQSKDIITIRTLAFRQDYVRQLRGIASQPDIEASGSDDDENINATRIAYQLVPMMLLDYLRGNYTEAAEHSARVKPYLEGVVSQLVETDYYLFDGLIAAALLRHDIGKQADSKRALQRSLKRFQKWQANQPDNFAQQHALLAAESAALDQNVSQATRLYEEATALARDNGFIHIEAISRELAARYLFKIDEPRKARLALSKAYDAYMTWKAGAKVKLLEEEFGPLVRPDPATTSKAIQDPSEDRLDLDSVLKVRQAVAAESRSEGVIERLLALALENVGGTYACLVLADDSQLIVGATADAREASVNRLGEVDLATAAIEPLLRFVIRTQQDVMLDDLARDTRFSDDRRATDQGVRSVLCTPLLHHRAIIGALYFENNLVTGAFSEGRLRSLQVIAAELANALDAASLQRELSSSSESLSMAQDEVAILRKAKEQLNKFVPQSVQRIIEDNPDSPELEKKERDVSVLFLDIEGYTALSQQLDATEMNVIIEQYFSSYLEVIHRHSGDINETLGDGLMIIFQDNNKDVHARNACNAAVDIVGVTNAINRQKRPESQPIAVNIGINSGTASVGSTRLVSEGGSRYTYTASGNLTNVAARIGGLAENGTILISAETATRVGSNFVMQTIGQHVLKNVAEPVELFELVIEQ